MIITLASASPRRIELIKKLNRPYKVTVSNCIEVVDRALSPQAITESLARQKAKEVYDREGGIVLGCDTVVVYNGEVIGKPKDIADAKRTLRRLSGNAHFVFTGISIIGKGVEISDYDRTDVFFNELSDALIDEYVKAVNVLDKAGSYGIQDDFGLVKSYNGSFYNIMGLPIEKIQKLLLENRL